MTETLKLDSSGIDKFILEAALKEEPIFDAYRTLCKTQGSPQMDYRDFERKYHQARHGNYNIVYERTLDNPSPVTFSDLPMFVLEKVVKGLSLVDCLALRKVSHALRNLVDTTEIHCESIGINFSGDHSTLWLGDFRFRYHKTDEGMCNVSLGYNTLVKECTDDRNFQQVMLADASTFLTNPRLKIDELKFNFDDSEEFPEFFKNLISLISPRDVRTVSICSPGHTVRPILTLLTPEILEEITLESVSTVDQSEDFVETEQWKKAKKWCWNEADISRLDKLSLFTEIQCLECEFTDESVIAVRELLLNSTRLEYCNIYLDRYDYYKDGNEIIEDIMRQTPAFDSETWRFSIPNSHDYFQLEFQKEVFDDDDDDDELKTMGNDGDDNDS